MLVWYRFFLEQKWHGVRQEYLVCAVCGTWQTTGRKVA
jgi:hypothetical protein